MARTPAAQRRIQWWREARFGMFLHWGLYAQLGRAEWVLNREKIPHAQYEPLADTWKPRRGAARAWARLAKRAGMKYMVLTTKHSEGFCLWDTQQTDYNAVARGPGRDLVAEYVEACRAEGLGVGLYYCIMDWHHPDGERCAHDPAARRRFLDFTRGCVRELLTIYGKIDILWYDCPWPLMDPDRLESRKLNRMVRRLQPDILTNDSSLVKGDFAGSELGLNPPSDGRPWESCQQLTRKDWGYAAAAHPDDWLSVRDVLHMLQTVTLHDGNLLLNVGPKPDGSLPPEVAQRLAPVGKWLARYGEAVYGRRERDVKRYLDWTSVGHWTRQGKTAYYWIDRWPGKETAIAGLQTKVKRITLLGSGRPVEFSVESERIVLTGLPEACPDKIAGITVLKLECTSFPHQELGMGRAAVDV